MTSPKLTHPSADPYWVGENIEVGKLEIEQLPLHFRSAQATEPDVLAWVQSLLDAADITNCPKIRTGTSLMIVGPTGVGKTYQAVGAIKAILTSGARAGVVFTTAADLYAQLRPQTGVEMEQVFRYYSRAGVLVLDDLGAAKPSEWTSEIDFRLINYRYENHLPTLITTNIPPKTLHESIEPRVVSRLREMCKTVIMRGDDRRR